jgi:hypothetical protein
MKRLITILILMASMTYGYITTNSLDYTVSYDSAFYATGIDITYDNYNSSLLYQIDITFDEAIVESYEFTGSYALIDFSDRYVTSLKLELLQVKKKKAIAIDTKKWSTAVIPEPSTAYMTIIGLGIFSIIVNRKRRL